MMPFKTLYEYVNLSESMIFQLSDSYDYNNVTNKPNIVNIITN